jgi:hypothetical protein
MRLHHPMLAEIGEMLRDFDLRRVENLLKMADTKWPIRKQMEYPQPRFIAEAFVNFDQLHAS